MQLAILEWTRKHMYPSKSYLAGRDSYLGDLIMASFTHYWSCVTCDDMVERKCEGGELVHTAGEDFNRHRVLFGDQIYVVNVRRGILYLIGRLRVAKVCSRSEAEAALKEDGLWEATEHLIAVARSGTSMRFKRKVSLRTAKMLRFPNKAGFKKLKCIPRGLLDRQTLRGVRRLDDASAKLLDRLIR